VRCRGWRLLRIAMQIFYVTPIISSVLAAGGSERDGKNQNGNVTDERADQVCNGLCEPEDRGGEGSRACVGTQHGIESRERVEAALGLGECVAVDAAADGKGGEAHQKGNKY